MNSIFDYFKVLFNEHGFRLYMIGGTSRDFLLGKYIDDYDLVSDATPDEIKSFLDVNMQFAKYGTVTYVYNKQKIDFVTLREESDYKDSRHPSKITFVKSIEKDYVRRDFTINALYIDENYKVIDPTGFGENDLKNRVLRFIGDPLKRIEEDPLRILRAKRFICEYNLNMSPEEKALIKSNMNLLDKLNKSKVEQEAKKFKKISGGKDYEF